jgi:hypothetical protein
MLIRKRVEITFKDIQVTALSTEQKYLIGAREATANGPKNARSFILAPHTDLRLNEKEPQLIGFIASYFTTEEEAAAHSYEDIPAYIIRWVRVAEPASRPIITTGDNQCPTT